jgi:hypothetical protein
MDQELSLLSWDQLQRVEGGIPWPALYTFADAVASDPEVIPRLFEVYDQAYRQSFEQPTFADFYVAGIFALAAPRLDEERRREIGSFLVARLVQAGRDDADVSLEILEAAAGTMGPVIVPAVLDAIAAEPDTRGAWIFLWNLTTLATRSEDEALRDRVIRASIDLLEKVERDEVDPGDGMKAAWTLAAFQRPEDVELLQRLGEKPMARWWIADYRGALQLAQGRQDQPHPAELWEEPVEQWLTSRCRMVEEAAAKAAQPTPPAETEDPGTRFAKSLTNGFLLSPIATGLPRELLRDAPLIVSDLVRLSYKYLGMHPRDWDEATLREVLLVLMPREMPADREQLRKIAPLTEAFLYWLGTQGLRTDTDALIARVHEWNDQIIARGSDRGNWGPIKTFVMDADPEATTEDKLIDFLIRHLAERTENPAEPLEPVRREPPLPIAEHSPKPARNAPCPCGSGQKYKKCHGRAEAEQKSNM